MIGKAYWIFVGGLGMADHFLTPQVKAIFRHQVKEDGLEHFDVKC